MRLSIKKSMKSDGFTIVELLIGLLVSLFIIGVSLTYFASSSRAYNVQSNDSVIQENARFALEILSQNIRLSGLNSDNGFDANLNGIYVQNLCSAGEGGDANGASGSTPCTRDGANNATENNSDRFAIDFILRRPAATCNGSNVTQAMLDNNGGQMTLANVFWTADAGNNLTTANVTRRALYCQTYQVNSQVQADGSVAMNGAAMGAPLPLVDGIERMQVQYGVDSNQDDLIDMYQSITNLGVNNVANIKAVRFGLLISSGLGIDSVANTEAHTQANRQTNSNRSYAVLDAPAEGFNDDTFRQIFSTTVLIPNGF